MSIIGTTAFVLTFVASFMWAVQIGSAFFGHSVRLPVPLLHIWDISFSNTYISTPSVLYQVYFWFKYFGVFNG